MHAVSTPPGPHRFVPLNEMQTPAPCKPGERVALVSPSTGLPQVFPHVHDLGVTRLRERFGLEPVEYPTTRQMDSSPRDRARDLHAAFADPSISAVFVTIGGDDQITVLPHLDLELLRANRKPFFGYSDNTNLLNVLMSLGMTGFHGGSTMVQLGRSGAMHPLTEQSMRHALFNRGQFELSQITRFSNYMNDWNDVAAQSHGELDTNCRSVSGSRSATIRTANRFRRVARHSLQST